MTITSIRYQPIEGGALGGHLALHVTLGADQSPEGFFSSTSIATRIHDCYEDLKIRYKAIRGVLIDCRSMDASVEEMTSLLGTLKDWGFSIVLWVDQHTRHPWFEFASYITVFVKFKNWPNFKVNEVRYVAPEDPTIWEEPEIYDVNASASCYFQMTQRSNPIAFLTDCKRIWGLIGSHLPAIAFKLKEA